MKYNINECFEILAYVFYAFLANAGHTVESHPITSIL